MVRSTLSVFSDFQLGRVGRICSGPRAPDFLNYASHFQHNLRSFSGVEVGFKNHFYRKIRLSLPVNLVKEPCPSDS